MQQTKQFCLVSVLLAAAAGIRVIASRACGLANVPGVTEVEAGDTASLRAGIEMAISCLN